MMVRWTTPRSTPPACGWPDAGWSWSGGGHVAQRRVPQLIAVGADVVLVSPEVTPAVEGLATAGEITWHRRGFEDADLDGRVVRHRGHRRHRRQRGGERGRRAAADLLRARRRRHAGHAPGPRPWAGTRASRSPCSATASRGAAPRSATRSSRGCARAPSSPGTSATGRRAWCWSAAGPGDPELISVAGRKALMEADVVVADRLAPRELLGELPADVELIDVAKLPRGRSAQQEEINRILVDRCRAGKRVVRFKGGDSFVFGRGFEEVEACRAAGVPVTVIPGLTSPIAVPGPGRHPGHPPRRRARLHGDLRAPAARAPGLAHRLGRRRPAARHAGADDGRRERPRDRRRAAGRWPARRTPRSRWSATAACRGSGPCSPRSAGSRDDLRAAAVQPPAIIVVGDVVAVAHPERYRG